MPLITKFLVLDFLYYMQFKKYLFPSYTLTVFTLLFYSCIATPIGKLNPERLSCENLLESIIIDKSKPRLSWINTFDSNERGLSQTAYRIQVFKSNKEFDNLNTVVWDSGKVNSSNSHLIPYGGSPLTSTYTYWWRVKVWDQDNNESNWSEVSNWITGYLNPEEWKAEWIGAPWQSEEPLPDPINPRKSLTSNSNVAITNLPPPAPLFRKEFKIFKPIEEAKAFVTGLGYFEFYVNGQKIEDDVLVPNQTDYGFRPDLEIDRVPIENKFEDFRVMYLGYDITSFLKQGENVLGAMLGNGFFNAPKTWTSSYGTPKFIGQIHIRYTDGTEDIIISDQQWKVEKGPITYDLLYEGEHYDARLEQKGWAEPYFDDSSWKKSVLRKKPEGKLVAHTSPTDKVMEVLKPLTVEKKENGNYLVDFGEEISGWLRINKVIGEAGRKIEIRYLSNDKISETTGSNSYILNGSLNETYAARFSWFVFRYVEISNWPGTLTEEMIQAEAVYTNVETTGVFETSNKLFNKINKLWWRSQTDNMHGGIASDCPNRERSPYTGDGQVACVTVMHNFDAKAFYTKWIEDILLSQNPESGYVPNAAPWQPGSGGGPAWGAAINIMPWEYYKHYGDTKIIQSSYEGMKKYATYMLNWTDERGIMKSERTGHGDKPFRWLNLGDWAQPFDLPKDELVHTFYLWRCLDITSKVAAALHIEKESEDFAQLAEKTKAAFQTEFYDPVGKSYGDYGGNIFALYMGLDSDQKAEIIQRIRETITKRNGHLDTGIFGTQFFFEVLADNGLNELAYNIMNKRTQPSYGWWVENGNTTFWEHWFRPGSGNHPMFGGGISWFYRKLAGMYTDETHPGYKRIIFKPYISENLDFVSYSNLTPHGRAGIKWDYGANTVNLTIQVPAGSSAKLFFPVLKGYAQEVTENGDSINNHVGDIKKLGLIDGFHVFEVSSGNYSFQREKI